MRPAESRMMTFYSGIKWTKSNGIDIITDLITTTYDTHWECVISETLVSSLFASFPVVLYFSAEDEDKNMEYTGNKH